MPDVVLDAPSSLPIAPRAVKQVPTQNAKWFLLLVPVVILFYWKVVFTAQFSTFLEWEEANQAYSWYEFTARALRQGFLPIWDPYTWSGRSFVGELQTGLFYPLKLLLWLAPTGPEGLLSPRALNQLLVFAHLLGAWFMFLLAREMGLKQGLSALIASLCFALGGFVGRVVWPNMLDSAIWLPLVFLCVLRALRSEARRSLFFAILGGLCLGMTVLAGSLHIPIMNTFAVVSAGLFFALCHGSSSGRDESRSGRMVRSVWVVLIVGAVAFATAAVQLLPSIEYSQLSVRYYGEGAVSTTSQPPYAALGHNLSAGGLLTFLFGAAGIGGSEISPYMGVLPLVLVVIGVWCNWANPWVKYLSGLCLVSLFYSLGHFFFLHGLLYLVPVFNMAWEPGRFLYVTHFAMALLAGFGVESLFHSNASTWQLAMVARALKATAITVLLILAIPTLYGQPGISDWHFFSLLLIVASWGVLRYVSSNGMNPTSQFVLISLILCDLYAFSWTIQDRWEEDRRGTNYLQQLFDARTLADFFKSQPGLFRVELPARAPNIGDAYGVQMTWGTGVTHVTDYARFLRAPRGLDMLNVRYVVHSEESDDSVPIFHSGPWKVYENPSGFPRGWVVSRVQQVDSLETVLRRLENDEYDPRRVALVSEPLPGVSLERESSGEVTVSSYQPNRIELEAQSDAPGMLVLSEIYYPGWAATVNGENVHIYRVNGMLRGVLIPAGKSRIVMEYTPWTIRVGAAVSLSALLGAFAFAGFMLWRDRRSRRSS